jgi:hypothetical protein
VLYIFAVIIFQTMVVAAIITLNLGAPEMTLYGDWESP